MFKHFIFIRYNWDLYTNNPYNLTDEAKDEYMKKRLPLFQVTLDSLKAQTNQNFTALISVDPNTPEGLRAAIELRVISMDMPNLKIIYRYQKDYVQSLKIEEPWLITSRIDNDDEYYPEFIETIQRAFRSEVEVLDVRGRQQKEGKLYTTKRVPPNSPFLTLVEKSNNIRTCFWTDHSHMHKRFNARFVGDRALYIQHIHDTNLVNKLNGNYIKER